MLWEEVRQAYPNKWIVFEAIEAHSDHNFRIVDDITVVDTFDDSMEAFEDMRNYTSINPNANFTFFIQHVKTWIFMRRNGQV